MECRYNLFLETNYLQCRDEVATFKLYKSSDTVYGTHSSRIMETEKTTARQKFQKEDSESTLSKDFTLQSQEFSSFELELCDNLKFPQKCLGT